MKKNYRKPTIESVTLNKVQLLAGSPCDQDTIGICTSYVDPCPSDGGVL
jgi:hypothetical protein